MPNEGNVVLNIVENDTAFEHFERYESSAKNFLIFKRWLSIDQAKDLISEVRLLFQKRYPELRDQSQIKSFIFQMVRDLLRRRWTEQNRNVSFEQTQEAGHQTPSQGRNPEEYTIIRERLQILKECIIAINISQTHKVAQLRFLYGMQYSDIAKSIPMPIGSVKTHIRRAKLLITECVLRKSKVVPNDR